MDPNANVTWPSTELVQLRNLTTDAVDPLTNLFVLEKEPVNVELVNAKPISSKANSVNVTLLHAPRIPRADSAVEEVNANVEPANANMASKVTTVAVLQTPMLAEKMGRSAPTTESVSAEDVLVEMDLPGLSVQWREPVMKKMDLL